jgi:hypothetical protein
VCEMKCQPGTFLSKGPLHIHCSHRAFVLTKNEKGQDHRSTELETTGSCFCKAGIQGRQEEALLGRGELSSCLSLLVLAVKLEAPQCLFPPL